MLHQMKVLEENGDKMVDGPENGLRCLKDYLEFCLDNDVVGSISDVIGPNATEEIQKDEIKMMSMMELINHMKKKFNLTSFQMGIFTGYLVAFSSIMQQQPKFVTVKAEPTYLTEGA